MMIKAMEKAFMKYSNTLINCWKKLQKTQKKKQKMKPHPMQITI